MYSIFELRYPSFHDNLALSVELHGPLREHIKIILLEHPEAFLR